MYNHESERLASTVHAPMIGKLAHKISVGTHNNVCLAHQHTDLKVEAPMDSTVMSCDSGLCEYFVARSQCARARMCEGLLAGATRSSCRRTSLLTSRQNPFLSCKCTTPIVNDGHSARTMRTTNLDDVGVGVSPPCVVESQPVGARNLLGLKVDDFG